VTVQPAAANVMLGQSPPLGRNYNPYAEPLVGLALPADFSDALADLCSANGVPSCQTPTVNTNFNVRIVPASP
jgi:hypothetical protein